MGPIINRLRDRLFEPFRNEPTDMCECGHTRERHTHVHDRDYCGTCGPHEAVAHPDGCSHFKRARRHDAKG